MFHYTWREEWSLISVWNLNIYTFCQSDSGLPPLTKIFQQIPKNGVVCPHSDLAPWQETFSSSWRNSELYITAMREVTNQYSNFQNRKEFFCQFHPSQHWTQGSLQKSRMRIPEKLKVVFLSRGKTKRIP